MKKIFFYSISVVLVSLLVSCKQVYPNRAYFSHQGKYDKITTVVPLQLGEYKFNMMLDTAAEGYFEIDSVYSSDNSLPEWDGEADQVYFANEVSPWASKENPIINRRQYSWHHKTITPKIGNTEVAYDKFLITGKRVRVDAEGMFGPPKNDTIHVWEFNFDQNYLEVHPKKNFKLPKNTYVFPFTKNQHGWPYVEFPVTLMSDNGESITIVDSYLIDTGATQDFILIPSEQELDFLKSMGHGVAIANMHGGFRTRYEVDATCFGDYELEDFRIYVDETDSYIRARNDKGILGMNFLKRFNVFFDFSTQEIAFQPIKNFERVVDPLIRKYYYSTYTTPDKKEIVSDIADTSDNPYREAGLQVNDEILSVNGYDLMTMTYMDSEEINKSNVREMSILRDGNIIAVRVVLSEEYMKGE
ncbi:hypothetical protein LJB91_00130 [Bacteroidales bacterium OttesenSCG-928-L03]|nr:hypothetical protein [Bacteroidales bacterium OttesenSCG-928-L03]